MPIQKKYRGFSVVNPSRPDCSFLIRSEMIKDWLYSQSIIEEPTRQATKMTLTHFLSGAEGREEFLDSSERSDGDGATIGRFMRVIGDQLKAVRKQAAEAAKNGRVSYQLLPYVFKKNDLVVVTVEPGVHHGARIDSLREVAVGFGLSVTYVSYNFVSFNGTTFVVGSEELPIWRFKGERSLEDFGVVRMSESARQALEKRGRQYKEVNTRREQMQYQGNLARKSDSGTWRIRADGRIMVDIGSFMRFDPNYEHYYGSIASSADDSFDSDDEAGKNGAAVDMNEPETLACHSPYVYGFSFAAKEWGEMLLEAVTDTSYRKDAFDRVVLEPKRKRIIRALVSSDFAKFSDVVDGKGSGCIFLLSGPTGVGKTVTAEAIAEELELPLYTVSAGELGIDPATVEQNLRPILEMAARWKAVLLIDECDTFLEKRKTSDVERNALVAIFLRLLEYYSGILFLTTNRVDELDEAVLSRVSVALHYRALDEEKRLQIWKTLAGGHDFESLDFNALAKHNLNGRAIKNCLKNALALAHNEKRRPTQADIDETIEIGLEFDQRKTK